MLGDQVHQFSEARDDVGLPSFEERDEKSNLEECYEKANFSCGGYEHLVVNQTLPCVNEDDTASCRPSVRATHRSGVSSRSRHSASNREPRSWPDPYKYNERSFCLFTLKNPFRKALIACIEWPWWDRTVLMVIFVNSIVLAMYDPYDIPQLLPTSSKRTALEMLSKVSPSKHDMSLLVE